MAASVSTEKAAGFVPKPEGHSMRAIRLSVLVLCGLVPLTSQGHHSYAEYDQQKTVEIRGKLVKVAFQNPHLSLKVEVAGQAPVTWTSRAAGSTRCVA
jgi:hypothetical protein